MKKLFLAGAAMLALVSGAQAVEYDCGRPTVYVGDAPDSNPVVSINVSYDPSEHAWKVFHNRADGSVVSRGQQYSMVDYSTGARTQWEGSLNRNRSIYMRAGMKRTNGGLIYAEEIFDRSINNALTMSMSTPCRERVVYRDVAPPAPVAQTPLPVPQGTVIQQTPAPAPAPVVVAAPPAPQPPVVVMAPQQPQQPQIIMAAPPQSQVVMVPAPGGYAAPMVPGTYWPYRY